MALLINDKFAPRANPGDANYPNGSIKNESAPGAKDGTPLDADWGNDYVGFDAALFAETGIVPSGNPDTVLNSQRLDALQILRVNELSQAHEFTYVTSMTSSTIVFPVGKRLKTDYHNSVSMDGGASYIVRAGSSPEPVGSPNLNGAFYAELQGKSGWLSPEVFGSDGTAAVDSIVIPVFMVECRKQLWKSNKTYNLDAAVIGDARGFKVFSNTEMKGYGATIDMQGAVNNGFYFGPENGVLKGIRLAGFNFTQTDVNSITNAMLIEGFIEDCIIEDNKCDGMDQYFIGMGGDDSGYNNLTVRNNRADNINPQGDNEFSLCYEFFPKVSSSQLYFHDNYGRQVGKGGVFKIHTTTNNFIHDNTFIRTTNVGDSQSQAVMLGGRSAYPVHNTFFRDNSIDDANGSLGALFIGNTSSGTHINGGDITGLGSIIWVGGSISDSDITNVNVALIQSLGATNDIVNLDVTNCKKLAGLNFQAPAGGNAPSSISGLHIDNNRISSNIRITTTGSSTDVTITENELIQTPATSFMYADNITFSGNTMIVSDTWAAGSQVIIANADNYKQFNNIWDLKGLVAQTTWLNGTIDAQVIGETVEDTITRVALDNGTTSTVFDNRQKINGGAWAVV